MIYTLNLVARAVSGPGVAREEGKWVFLADPDHIKQVFTADPDVVRTGETNGFLLQAVVAHADLRPARSDAERIRPRFITLAPSRRGEVIVA